MHNEEHNINRLKFKPNIEFIKLTVDQGVQGDDIIQKVGEVSVQFVVQVRWDRRKVCQYCPHASGLVSIH